MSTKASLMRTVKRHGSDTLCRHCRQSINTTPHALAAEIAKLKGLVPPGGEEDSRGEKG